MTPGRIDVHSHLLPGLDDGCATVGESLRCAAALVEAGYTHSVCTPHVWPSLPNNNPATIPAAVAALQARLDAEHLPLRLIPGGEHNFRPSLDQTPPAEVVTYGMSRTHVLIDLWAERLPTWFERQVRWLQSLGLTVVLAHPERMRAVQDDPDLADAFDRLGLKLQGNLQCLSDPPATLTRRVGERFLRDGRYFLLGTDLHNWPSLGPRLAGLRNAIEMVGHAEVDRLTRENPRAMLGPSVADEIPLRAPE